MSHSNANRGANIVIETEMNAERNRGRSGSTVRGDRMISYELVEGGPTKLVLLAGTGLPGEYWTLAQTAKFRDWATCLLVDNAGAGNSDPLPDGKWTTTTMALDVVAIMDEIGWEAGHIAGHSLGSAIALQLAITHSNRVLSLSLHSTWAATSLAPHVKAWLEARQATAAANDPTLWMRYSFFLVSPDHFALHHFESGALGSVSALIAAVGRGAHVGQYEAGLNHEAADQLASIDVPTLVTVGVDDFVTLPEYGRAVAGSIPGAQFVELAHAGHMAALEQSERFNEQQRLFIKSITEKGSD